MLDVSEQTMNLIKDAFGNLFQAYYIGVPDVIPEAALPCVIVQKTKSSYALGPTGADDITEELSIDVMASTKIDLGTPDDDDTTMRTLELLIEAVDSQTGTFKPNTFMSVLRKGITLDQTIIENSLDVSYDSTPRQNQPTIAQAMITMTTLRRVYIPNRF